MFVTCVIPCNIYFPVFTYNEFRNKFSWDGNGFLKNIKLQRHLIFNLSASSLKKIFDKKHKVDEGIP